MENYILNVFKEEKINFWRTTAKAEVDFILKEKTPLEVKITPKITRALRSFIFSYKPEIALIANLNSYPQTKIGKTEIFVVPAALL